MKKETYIVATIRPWNIKAFYNIINKYPGDWHLISSKEDLNIQKLKTLKPRYIFFPHWSEKVPKNIINTFECVCFHETDLPYGRGGSPIQNLIILGHTKTVITALKMNEEFDSGPIYLKESLSLEGLAEEIYNRASIVVAEMIKTIITNNPKHKKQVGKPVIFK